jgi:hypothetical protein
LGGFTTLFAATETPDLVRGVALLNSAGQFADKPAAAAPTEEEEESNPLSRFVVKPLKEAFQRVVLGFLFWQSKQPARVEKVLKSVRNVNYCNNSAALDRCCLTTVTFVCPKLNLHCRCILIPATSTITSSAPSRRRRPTPTPARSTTG